MSIYDYLNYFWSRNQDVPCSQCEVALYHYLLFEANRQHWIMPIKVVTKKILCNLKMGKSSVMRAREGLMDKGFIRFSIGKGKDSPTQYVLLSSLQKDNQGVLENGMLNRTHDMTQIGPPNDSKCGTGSGTHLNNITIRSEEDNNIPFISSSSNKDILPVSELHLKLIGDETWLDALMAKLKGVGIDICLDSLRHAVDDFFEMLQSKGITEKNEDDCKNYIFNWIKYHNKKNNYGQDSRNKSKSGRINIADNRPEDYAGLC